MGLIERRAADCWDDVMVPEVGCFPPVLPALGIRKERVLHVALRDAREKQPGLEKALRGIASEYGEVDWIAEEQKGGPDNVSIAILKAASKLKPEIIFMQLQRHAFPAGTLSPLRPLCDPNVVIVNWDGDQHFEPHSPERAWFVELGKVCDASLVVNTKHPHEYKRMGVKNPGYLQIGTDDRWHPSEYAKQWLDAQGIIWLANSYEGNPKYSFRRDLVEMLCKKYGKDRFGVYGSGWEHLSCGHPFVPQDTEHLGYTKARGAISSSIRADLPRYTSDRLFRILASGGLALVEQFPDYRGLGLDDNENCLIWETTEELLEIIDAVLDPKNAPDWDPIRAAARELAVKYHMWEARMPELLYIVDTVRRKRNEENRSQRG